MENFGETKYFLQAHFYPMIEWEQLEDAVIDFRKVSRKDRFKFKEEILYFKQLLAQKQYDKIQDIINVYELEYTQVCDVDEIQRLVNEILPIIEKYEYKEDISYVPMKALYYIFDTIFIPTKTFLSFDFIAIDIQREGDTFIQHFKQDLQYVEKTFSENDETKKKELLKIANDKGVYILESEYRDSFIQEMFEGLS
ncbi:hypothetical protein [Lysinibacillus sp. JNUCC 51]|uniref:hypothetical protein n=1 Tax=Lysinibacillus sp. JNUCC-51 TaxID=2792479 RepID=UPI0019386FB4|nr:hypothetical protein JNUCC51_01020 [Lysinibacillus sp. JNUCC-51]